MAGLTPPEVREIVKVIQEINAGGVTILLIEHIMEAIMSLSHHIIVISFGKRSPRALGGGCQQQAGSGGLFRRGGR